MEVQAWGTGVFDNRDATDWLEDLIDTEDLQAIMLALGNVVELAGTEELDSIDCCIALAAAEVVAAAGGKPSKEMTMPAKRFLKRMNLGVARPVQELALKALDNVRTQGSLLKHWKQANLLTEWLGVLESLEERLNTCDVVDA